MITLLSVQLEANLCQGLEKVAEHHGMRRTEYARAVLAKAVTDWEAEQLRAAERRARLDREYARNAADDAPVQPPPTQDARLDRPPTA